jgi:hypothetical protein
MLKIIFGNSLSRLPFITLYTLCLEDNAKTTICLRGLTGAFFVLASL